jgi:hypothetical protein
MYFTIIIYYYYYYYDCRYFDTQQEKILRSDTLEMIIHASLR